MSLEESLGTLASCLAGCLAWLGPSKEILMEPSWSPLGIGIDIFYTTQRSPWGASREHGDVCRCSDEKWDNQ